MTNRKIIFFIFVCLFVIRIECNLSTKQDDILKYHDVHYNIPDPDCSGPFGLCTQEDKDRLGYFAIKKLHEKMDDDRDGQVELKETKEFMTEELQYKNGVHDREKNFHGNDLLISVDEMWKSWQYSHVYNWTIDDVVIWVNEQVKLPQYAEYFKRNKIDGQFLPRLAINDNHYYSNVMQIKDSRHKRLLMLKATDIVLFGQQQKPHNLVKDALLLGALTLSIIFSLYLYTKHRQSLDRIKRMMIEVEKLGSNEEAETLINQLKNNLKNGEKNSELLNNSSNNKSTLSLLSLRRRSVFPSTKSNSASDDFNDTNDFKDHLKQSQIMSAKNHKLTEELNKAKVEADYLRKARENTDGQLKRLDLAEQELDKVRAALKQTETRLELVKYQPPQNLISLLNRTYESERELLEYKFNIIKKEKESCYDALNKISKRQSGLLGALKIAHSSTLEEINHKLEILKREVHKCNSEKHEWTKRWNNIDELCNRANDNTLSESGSQEQQDMFITLENGLILPRKIWQTSFFQACSILTNTNTTDSLLSNSISFKEVQGDGRPDELKNDNSNEPSIPSNNSLSQLNNVSTIQNKKSYQNKSISNLNQPNDETKNKVYYNSINQLNINGNRSTPIAEQTITESKVEFNLNENDDTNNNNLKAVNYNASNQFNSTMANSSQVAQQTAVTFLDHPSSVTQPVKIARESFIHKNDVFTFDDVESVHTHDSLFRQTPHSSFELDGTRHETKAKKKLADNKIIASLISPILRTVNSSQTSSINKHLNKVKPQQNPSISSHNSSPKLIKNVQNGEKVNSSISLERSNTFSKRLNGLKRLIGPRNSAQNLNIPNGDLVKSSSVDLIPIPSSKELQIINLQENNSTSVDNFNDQHQKPKSRKLFSFRLSKSKRKSPKKSE